ncbi:acyl-CoA dehydratase activase [Tepidibacter formicigenes]|jgi:predicted CoA-substrate-specific enzyme activase|uniref:CoA-substrate-specific enzyme activase, putative n=1 Tax=Tepidibacter formicigenes DSM 15518 TaxID=1123349 RepID=A0A1M6S896_9FIRM|nr:acyl-CoA dehydratase activase [Tepidibacter formicigenes]SHK40737.1 CoA-substrate-specific enzyme activase, putative [Tepidibacter formicigenes DSM 15518]
MENVYLGIDVGSVSTNIVVIDDNNKVLEKLYIRTMGNPINVLKEGLRKTKEALKNLYNIKVAGVGTTGSGRELASVMVGADVVKNEITAHAIAALNFVPGVRTILEIGGQDSKIILLRNNIISDFAMNTVCAAGTGSFLDRQASRLGIPIEEFGSLALNSSTQVRIAGRCAVFAESDMIHKQQLGYSQEDIINGLCEALVRNYLNNLAKGKDIEGPIVFQGGVAANIGIKKAFERALECEIYVPEHHNVMGAIGSALLAKEEVKNKEKTNFLGFDITDKDFKVKGFECDNCPNVCEVVGIYRDDELVARWGDKCGKWSNLSVACTLE